MDNVIVKKMLINKLSGKCERKRMFLVFVSVGVKDERDLWTIFWIIFTGSLWTGASIWRTLSAMGSTWITHLRVSCNKLEYLNYVTQNWFGLL